MKNEKKEMATLPNGMKCFKEFEKEALGVWNKAYDRNFDGNNYEYAEAVADVKLTKFMMED